MKNETMNPGPLELFLVATVALVMLAGLVSLGCEVGDDFNSGVTCSRYCSKKFACQDVDPSSSQTRDCVDSCRDSIENRCGNENQAAANSKIDECVDKGCAEFWTCMVFEAAPECYGFVGS